MCLIPSQLHAYTVKFKVHPGFPTSNLLLLHCCSPASAHPWMNFRFYVLSPFFTHSCPSYSWCMPCSQNQEHTALPCHFKVNLNTTTGSSWLLCGPCNFYSDSTHSSFSGLTGQHVTLSTHRPWAGLRTSPLALPCLEHYSPEYLHELPSVSFRPHGGLHTSKSHTLVNTSQLTHFLSSFSTSTYHLLT